MTTLTDEVQRRRTFAIISHPDAGKTTLTEKLLLFGGAIHLAGSVKARRSKRHATSDWMELERQRGISITSSVLQFPYDGLQINLLDTPGHQDFSEDTYRTLCAVDSAVMLIDSGKGVETQTKKLFQVCRMRAIPIVTFVNKMDRIGRDPLDLMDDLEKVLGIRSCPMNWPIGMGSDFKGVYDRASSMVQLYSGTDHGSRTGAESSLTVDDPLLLKTIGEGLYKQLIEDIEMLDIAGDPFDAERVRRGELTPLFFGSAMTNFGVRPFFDAFIHMAPPPGSHDTTKGVIEPGETLFSGFVFKIQANMNPSHRDCIAFIRVCSGTFTKGMVVNQPRTGRTLRMAHSHQFLATERTEVEEAFAGDIVGLFDAGNLRIGDTLTEEGNFEFEGIPRFSPEHFAALRLTDPSKRKQMRKGLDQLCAEGAVQVFYRPHVGEQEPILGAIGTLQFDVLQYRLQSEYNVKVELETLSFDIARWVEGTFDPGAFNKYGWSTVLEDRDGLPVVLFRDEWCLQREKGNHPSLKFLDTAPHIKVAASSN
ncbi:MAG: peptide chain release factor 3 [Candidatus Sericytochromatia bacterium]|nr:peptide chain release factor 3 [Candidatus Sericytochromatia bacterium]